jgi:hypothetical protein
MNVCIYTCCMTPRAKKLDLNQLAKSIVDQATGETAKVEFKAKNSEAIARGKKRMGLLTDQQKSELGKKAREARAIREALAIKTSANSLSVKQN